LHILGDLAGARDRGEHYLAFQPKVEIGTQRTAGLEALLRWKHPTLGDIEPAEFIPVARHGALIRDLDYWALHETCSQISAWRKAGFEAPPVAVNISSNTLDDPDFASWLEQELKTSGIPGGSLGLDLREDALHPEQEQREVVLSRLDEMGVRLAVDDFGTGYTSLTYLTRLPLKELKIDPTLIAQLGSNPRTEAIISAIAGMCRALSIDIVAEGVETESQAECLAAYGPLLAQGFCYGRPQSAAEVQQLLTARAQESSAA
jgi:EAL domain-containing protein (putative c-di-GMP-specific phosphodiesterase class I)